jgi:hypothetical protein
LKKNIVEESNPPVALYLSQPLKRPEQQLSFEERINFALKGTILG